MACENDHIVCASCYPDLRRKAVPGEQLLEYMGRLVFGRVSCPMCRAVGPFIPAPDIDVVIAALNAG